MFDRICQAAEQVATRLSRRGFLGRLAQLAGGTALALAGVLTANQAHAAPGAKTCCFYFCGFGPGGGGKYVCRNDSCPTSIPGYQPKTRCTLSSAILVADCRQCGFNPIPVP